MGANTRVTQRGEGGRPGRVNAQVEKLRLRLLN